jgi:hypothetical protein
MAPSRIALIVAISAAVLAARLVGGTVGLVIAGVLGVGMGVFWWQHAPMIVDNLRATEQLRTRHARSTQVAASKVFGAVTIVIGFACLVFAAVG